MRTITIGDKSPTGALAFDLCELLSLIRTDARRMEWIVDALECSGSRADELHDLAALGSRVTGDALLELAQGIEQVVEGEFLAYEKGSSSPTYLLRAVDSSAWDIAAERDELLNVFRKHFKVVFEAGDVD